MLKKLVNSIKKGTFFKSIGCRLRFVGRIKNRNVYEEYTRCREYEKLERKYKKIIENGVDENLPKCKSNKIWVCWLQGLENAPDIVKACVNSLRNIQDKEVIVLTSENIKDYVQFPKYIEEKFSKGIIPYTQFTDLLRLALICKFGGCWIDSTVLCTVNKMPNYIENSKLFVYRQMDLYNYKKDLTPIVSSSWFIYSESNNPILLLTQKLLYEYWKNNNVVSHYLIVHLFFSMATRRYPNIWNDVPVFNNCSPHTLQQEIMQNYSENRWNQLLKISDFHKLNRRNDYSSYNKSFYNYIIKKYL